MHPEQMKSEAFKARLEFSRHIRFGVLQLTKELARQNFNIEIVKSIVLDLSLDIRAYNLLSQRKISFQDILPAAIKSNLRQLHFI